MSNATLGDLVYKVLRELNVLTEGTATGGSATTIVDTVFRTEADDYWNGGLALIVYDAGGAGAAPQGEYKLITDFTASSDTITISTASTAIASGDRYAIAKKPPGENANWSEIVVQNINRALMDMGPIPITDSTSITTASDQTEYSLPLAAKQDLRQVWIQTDTTDANANLWRELFDPSWYVQRSAAGTQDLLVFNSQPPSPYALKLVYVADHAELVASTDQLNESVPLQRVVYPAVRDTLRWMKAVTQWDRWDLELQRWEERAELALTRYPIRYPKKHPKLVVPDIWGNLHYESTANKVYL